MVGLLLLLGLATSAVEGTPERVLLQGYTATYTSVSTGAQNQIGTPLLNSFSSSNFNSQAAGAALAETSNGDQAAAAAKAAATAFSKASDKSVHSPFAENYASALAAASSKSIDSASLSIAQSSAAGGNAQHALAVATARAFSDGGDKASSVAKSYSAAIARYGCNTVRPTLLKAQSIANDNHISAFATGVAQFISLTFCLNGDAPTAEKVAKAEAQAYGFSLNVPSSAKPIFNNQIFSQINSGRKLS